VQKRVDRADGPAEAAAEVEVRHVGDEDGRAAAEPPQQVLRERDGF
jgi:hypothetical protein